MGYTGHVYIYTYQQFSDTNGFMCMYIHIRMWTCDIGWLYINEIVIMCTCMYIYIWDNTMGLFIDLVDLYITIL
jgi:hypothetical protein